MTEVERFGVGAIVHCDTKTGDQFVRASDYDLDIAALKAQLACRVSSEGLEKVLLRLEQAEAEREALREELKDRTHMVQSIEMSNASLTSQIQDAGLSATALRQQLEALCVEIGQRSARCQSYALVEERPILFEFKQKLRAILAQQETT